MPKRPSQIYFLKTIYFSTKIKIPENFMKNYQMFSCQKIMGGGWGAVNFYQAGVMHLSCKKYTLRCGLELKFCVPTATLPFFRCRGPSLSQRPHSKEGSRKCHSEASAVNQADHDTQDPGPAATSKTIYWHHVFTHSGRLRPTKSGSTRNCRILVFPWLLLRHMIPIES